MTKDETINLLHRLIGALNSGTLTDTSETIDIEKSKSDNLKLLRKFENSNCLRSQNSFEIYLVDVPGIAPFPAPCESRLMDGGWTVIQRRLDGTVSFDRSWNEYRNGFGDLNGEFFIGLEKLHKITEAQPQELLINIESFNYETKYFFYNNFLIGSEEEEYVLKSAEISGAPHYNSLGGSVGEKFTTFDRDNDRYWWDNCAKEFKGGWWFGAFDKTDNFSNLNGARLRQNSLKIRGITFASDYNLKSVQMMIRPKQEIIT